jgi:hypothetical protein
VLVEGHVGGHGRGVGVVALGGEELLEGVFYALSALYQFTCMTKTRTVYSPLVWPVVTEPLGRPVAPVAALDSTGTRKVPTTLAWSRTRIHHRAMECVRERYRRLGLWCGKGAEAGRGERRVVLGTLAFGAHVFCLCSSRRYNCSGRRRMWAANCVVCESWSDVGEGG